MPAAGVSWWANVMASFFVLGGTSHHYNIYMHFSCSTGSGVMRVSSVLQSECEISTRGGESGRLPLKQLLTRPDLVDATLT